MSSGFFDHFSGVADSYALSRPSYPPELFAWLAAVAPARERAWDCGCGSGQATSLLAGEFATVVATDPATAQLAHAPILANVEWREALAEDSGLDDHSIDAVVIAQALHWFDLERFWPEVRRVLRPDGVVLALSYAWQSTGDGALDALLMHFARDTVGPHWPAERRHVETGYSELSFPFTRLVPPAAAMRAKWDAGRELGYLRSWSATRRAREVAGVDPVAAIEVELRRRWGERPREVAWPLAILAGVVDGDR